MKLKGLIAAPFTPMHADGTLNHKKIPEYYRMLKHNRVAGAFICGSTGEGVSLTLEEKKIIMKEWGDCTRSDPDFKIITLVGGTCLADCRELAVYARECGLYAISFTAPYYFKPSDVEMLAKSCADVASAVPDMFFYYYHIPTLTGAYLNMIDLLKAVDGTIPNFAGIKYTQPDFVDYLLCLDYKDGKYDMLWGRDENMLAALSLGAAGAVGSTYNYAAPLYLQLMEAFEKRDLEKAKRLQLTSIHMVLLLGKYGGISTGKAFMKAIGMDCGHFRLPVQNMSSEQFARFIQDLENLEFSSFSCKMP